MARDSNTERHNQKSDRDTSTNEGGSHLGRRTFMKTAGAAFVSAGAMTASSRLTDAAEYETITVPAGTVKTINVGDGETFENKLIDMTADGASVKILTSGSGWTIRNVGFKGEHPGGNYLMIPGVADSDGQGLIENVYMGDGQPDGSLKGAIWVNANMPHRGTITFRNFHMAHLINGLYASGPGVKGAGGNIQVENSYFYSNSVANIRTNGLERSNLIKDTVVHVDGTQPTLGSDTTAPGSKVTRAIWSWYGDCHLENCDIVGNFATSKNGSITQSNTRTGDQADTTPPAGVPMSAEEAASGSSTTSDDSSTTTDSSNLPNTLSISGGTASTLTSYSFAVSDTIEKSTDRNASINEEDTITDNAVEGVVAGGTDSYRFSGTISAFSIDGEATVFRNDEEVDPLSLSDETDSSQSISKHVIIDGSASEGACRYTFQVENGDVEKDAEHGSVNSFDSISDGAVTGRVIGGKDAYRYTGTVTEFNLEGTAEVRFEEIK